MATDHMHGMEAERLLGWILEDLKQGSALGIVKDLFFLPDKADPFRMERYGVTLETPVGVAAGPHTQMAQNIIAAWLCGARYIELKTVQVLDSIAVAKPCIDMADEGYNCEWSQELSLDQSYAEYLNAWVLVHVLHDHLVGEGSPGMIFNMSAGYSMEGILSPTVQRFLDRMQNCAADVEAMKQRLAGVYPRAAALDIPGCMSDNLTISCMHGCPPDEVEKIALYFLTERKLNTTLKMNPTLLGAQCVRGLLNKTLGYDIEVPDIAFAHDLPYAEALRIIRNCRQAAAESQREFSIKLTNTLETVNPGKSLPEKEQMVYMSGRALHPISIALAERLQKNFGGELDISFCAGVDALNVADTLACGLGPVTVCSDLLKPGGYGRLAQYLANIRAAMSGVGADSLESFILKTADVPDWKSAVLKNLEDYVSRVSAPDSRYAKSAVRHADVKTARPLPALDCFAAACTSRCPTGQNIPAYMEHVARGDMDGALAVIMDSNPFPNVLGAMCNQACRESCMRVQYDQALRIRDVKGCAAGAGKFAPKAAPLSGHRAAVVGAGAAGLSCAYFLALAGCAVDVYEAEARAGGRRLSKISKSADTVDKDLDAIRALGVFLHLEHRVDRKELEALSRAADAVYLATEDADLDLPAANVFRRGAPRPEGTGKSASPSLVASVGEGRRASAAILARLGLLPSGSDADGRGGADVARLRRRQAFRLPMPPKSLGADPSAARAEAARCLQCDRYCGMCVSVCPNRAYVVLPSEARSWPVQEAVRVNGGALVRTVGRADMRQTRQVVHIGDFCNECGNCAAFCPSAGAPYKEKLRLHLSRASFEADNDGCFMERPGVFAGKTRGRAWTIARAERSMEYDDADMRVLLDAVTLSAEQVELKNAASGVSLVPAVEAALLCSLVASDPALAYMAAQGPHGGAS